MEKRPFDVILYGATGFTGRQTVRYFEQYAPPGVDGPLPGVTVESSKHLASAFRSSSRTRRIRAKPRHSSPKPG